MHQKHQRSRYNFEVNLYVHHIIFTIASCSTYAHELSMFFFLYLRNFSLTYLYHSLVELQLCIVDLFWNEEMFIRSFGRNIWQTNNKITILYLEIVIVQILYIISNYYDNHQLLLPFNLLALHISITGRVYHYFIKVGSVKNDLRI